MKRRKTQLATQAHLTFIYKIFLHDTGGRTCDLEPWTGSGYEIKKKKKKKSVRSVTVSSWQRETAVDADLTRPPSQSSPVFVRGSEEQPG